MRLDILDAAIAQYDAQIKTSRSEIKTLITNPQGVGDHAVIVKDVVDHIDKIESAMGRKKVAEDLRAEYSNETNAEKAPING